MRGVVGSFVVVGVAGALVGCGGTDGISFPASGGAPPGNGVAAPDAGAVPVGSEDAGGPVSTPVDATVPAVDSGDPPFLDAEPIAYPDASVGIDAAVSPDAGDLLGGLRGITSQCTIASKGTYATDRSSSAAIDICKLNGAFFWTADMAIDCDGQKTTECNSSTDSSFSAQTSVTQSNGQPLIASKLPYVVIPLPSGRFDYTKQDIRLGAVAIVLYGNQMAYGVFGDEGPTSVIGEASYAMAAAFGLPPGPKNGGTSGAVTYIVLTGPTAVVAPVEDHAAAVTLGSALAQQLIQNN